VNVRPVDKRRTNEHVESGEAEGSVAVQPGEGEGLVIGLNCDYVSDFLKVTDKSRKLQKEDK